MAQKRLALFKHLDYFTVAIYIALVVMGWFTIYAAGYNMNSTGLFDLNNRSGSQLTWMGITGVVIIIILIMDDQFIKQISPPSYIAMMILLVATIFLAPDIKGSHSWLVITDSIRLQPAEFAKVTTAMMLALWSSRYEFSIKNKRDLIVSIFIFILPILVILLQNETGSAIVFLSFFIVMYREGLTGSIILIGFFFAVLFILSLRFAGVMWGITNADLLISSLLIYLCTYIAIELYGSLPYLRKVVIGIPAFAFGTCAIMNMFTPIDMSIPALISLGLLLLYMLGCGIFQRGHRLWLIIAFSLLSIGMHKGVEVFFNDILQPHQQIRILVSLGLKDDPSGAGYNVNQSLIAIGSGGLTGKGFLNGTQTKLKFVPEQDTDFIFCTIGEEKGFIGALTVLCVFLILLIRLIYLAERQSDPYARIYGYSVATIFFFHIAVNIGMVTGLTPVIGIPLPFFSYGGSSLLSFSILLFIFLRLDAARKEDN